MVHSAGDRPQGLSDVRRPSVGKREMDAPCTRGSQNVVSEHWDDGTAKARWQVYEVPPRP